MVTQRAEGIKAASSRYLLLLDDDITFNDTHAIEKLFAEMLRDSAHVALPWSPEAFPQGGVRKFVYALFGIAAPSSERRLHYMASGGFRYPRKPPLNEPYETEGGFGCCIATDRDFLLRNAILGDADLEKIPYALRDDGAFVLNVVLHGGKAILVGNISYDHLGGKRRLTPQRLYQNWKAAIYNNYIFWRKYILKRYRLLIVPIAAFVWHVIGLCLLAILTSLHHKSLQPIIGVAQGFKMIVQEWVKKKP